MKIKGSLTTILVVTLAVCEVASSSTDSATDSVGPIGRHLSCGLAAGVNLATTTDADVGVITIQSHQYTGYAFGVFADYTLSRRFSLRSNFLYSRIGFSLSDIRVIDESGAETGAFKPKQFFDYIDILVMGSYDIGLRKDMQLSLLSGPALGILLVTKSNEGPGAGSLAPDHYVDVSDLYRSIDWAAVFGARFSFHALGSVLFAEGRYAYSLTSSFKERSSGREHRVLSFLIGYEL